MFIFGRQSNDSRKLEGGCDIGNPRFGVVGGEAMVVFDDVFVPNERIFLNGEVEVRRARSSTTSRPGTAPTTAAARAATPTC